MLGGFSLSGAGADSPPVEISSSHTLDDTSTQSIQKELHFFRENEAVKLIYDPLGPVGLGWEFH